MAATAFPKLGSCCSKSHPAEPAHHKDHHSHPAEPLRDSTTCNFCSHLANRLDARTASLERMIAKMSRQGRHIPYGLRDDAKRARRDAKQARLDAETHSTRDDDRRLVCPRLLNHVCDMCGCKGHTRSRCAPCGYCGEVGHIVNECPKELADNKARGDTLVLRGVSPTVMAYIQDALEGIALYPTQTKPGLWEVDCQILYHGIEEDDGGVWDVIETA